YGSVSYDKDKCIGCGYCSQFCPFDVPQLDASLISGVGKMAKCTLCTTPGLDRLSTGEEPACVKACPSGALIFGDREELVAEGRRRVAALKSPYPNAYSKAMLYGETELGGLHVLHVLADSPEVYGLPNEPQFPATATIQKEVLRPFAWIVWPVVVASLALNVLVTRVRQIQKKGEG
ncbi:4Fe-4S dicluster domain-containing protein, partial [Chloroflexota bacterium]